VSDTDATTTASDAQAAQDADAQAQAATGSAQVGADDSSSGSLSSEDARKLRSEAANLRKRLKEAEETKKQLEDSDLTERQKLDREKKTAEARAEQLEAKLRDAVVQAVAAKVGVKSDLVDTVSALIDWADVDAEDSKAIERAVKEIVKERPSLSGRPDGLDGGAGRRGRSEETDMNALIRRAAGRA